MSRQERLRALPLVGLLAIVVLSGVALGELIFSRDQNRVATVVEAVVSLCGAASSIGAFLLRHLRQRSGAEDGLLGGGVAVLVPTGQLPREIRGRDELMRQLRRLLHASSPEWVVLAGMGGAGKSTVTAAFADQVQRGRTGLRRTLVWWVSAADQASFTGGLVTVASQLGASRADLEAVRACAADAPDRLWELLRGVRHRWLLVFDNADDPSVLARPTPVAGTGAVPSVSRGWPADGTGWLRPANGGMVIVSSRSSDPATWGRHARILEVDPLDDDDAAQVLLDFAAGAGDRDEATLLARHLGGLPLALRLAGSYLDSPVALRRSFHDYRLAMHDPGGGVHLSSLRLGMGAVADDRLTVMRTWEMSLDALAQAGTPQARPLLRLLSCYAPAIPIPLALLAPEILERLLVPGGAGQRAAGHYLEEGLHELTVMSLLDARRFGGIGQDKRALVVHPVIADTSRLYLLNAVHDRVRRDEATQVYQCAIDLIVSCLSSLDADDPADWPWYLALGPHLHAVTETVASHCDHEQLRSLVRTASAAARAHNRSGFPAASERLSDAALSILPLLGQDDTASLQARHQSAMSLAIQGRFHDAEALYRNVLADRSRALGSDHPDTLWTRHELAWITAVQGRWADAEAAYREVFAIRRRILGGEHPDTLMTRHELGWAIGNRGRPQEAEGILTDVLDARSRVLGEVHPRTLWTKHELAWMAASQERWAEAETAYRALLAVRRQTLGGEHPDTLTTAHELAWTVAAQGRRTEALSLYHDIIDARQRVLGIDHPETVRTREALSRLQDGMITPPTHIALSARPNP